MPQSESAAAGHPLAGIRVVDLADEKGELCGRLLADLGADVIRVEPPDGARSRRLPPFHAARASTSRSATSNKRGVDCSTSRSAAERERLHELLAGADVLIESASAGRAARRSVSTPSALARRHPHLVVTSISDFGQTGPYRDWVATDAVLEAIGGMMFKAGLPTKPPLIPPGRSPTTSRAP